MFPYTPPPSTRLSRATQDALAAASSPYSRLPLDHAAAQLLDAGPLLWTPRSTAGVDTVGGGAATAALDAALSAAARREALLLARVDDLQLQCTRWQHDASAAQQSHTELREAAAQQRDAAEKERVASAAELKSAKNQAEEAVALAERLTDSLRTAAAATAALRRENERLTRALSALRESRETAQDGELADLNRRLASMQVERDAAVARETVAVEAGRQERSSRQEVVRTAVARARADLNAQLEEASTRAAAAQHKAHAARVVASTCRRAAEGVRSDCERLQKANAALLALNARLLARFLRATWRVDELGDDGSQMEPVAAQLALTRRRLGGMPRLRRAEAEDTAASVEAQLLSMLTAATGDRGHALPTVEGGSEFGEEGIDLMVDRSSLPYPPSSPSPPPPPLLGAADLRVLARVAQGPDLDSASGGWEAFVSNAEAALDTLTGRDAAP
jgi:chromosome segregation ATPase